MGYPPHSGLYDSVNMSELSPLQFSKTEVITNHYNGIISKTNRDNKEDRSEFNLYSISKRVSTTKDIEVDIHFGKSAYINQWVSNCLTGYKATVPSNDETREVVNTVEQQLQE